MYCWLRAIPSVLPLFRCISFPLFLMSEWREVVNLHRHEKQSRVKQAIAGQRQPEWQLCEVLHAQLPQQERLPGLWKGERVAEGLVCRREGSDGALAAPERWRDDLRSGDASGQHREGIGPSSCADSASAGAGKEAGDAPTLHPCVGVQGAEGGGRDETGSARGPEDGLGASQISLSCRRGREGAGSHAQSLGELRASSKRLYRPNWTCTSSCRKLQHLIHANFPDVISDLVPGGRRSFGSRGGRRAGPRPLGPRRGRCRGEGRLREGACSRRAASGGEADTQGRRGTRTVDAATAEEDANHRAGGDGERGCTRAMRNPRDTEIDTLSQRACALVPALASS